MTLFAISIQLSSAREASSRHNIP